MEKPPIGLIPKEFHDRIIDQERFIAICDAISRYYSAGLQIDIKWIEEYNDLVVKLNQNFK